MVVPCTVHRKFEIKYHNTDLYGSSWMKSQKSKVPCLLISVFTYLDLQISNHLRDHDVVMGVLSLVLFSGLNLQFFSFSQ